MNCPQCQYTILAKAQHACPNCGLLLPVTSHLEPAAFVLPAERQALLVHTLPARSATARTRTAFPPAKHEHTLAPGMPLQGKRYLLVERRETWQWSSEIWETWWLAHNTEHAGEVLICEVVLSSSNSTMQAFIRSATKALLAWTDDPFLPPLLDVFLQQEHGFFVFASVAGESLRTLLQRNAVSESAALECYQQIAAVLLSLSQHHPPLVHGAILPQHLIQVQTRWMLTPPSVLVAGEATRFLSPLNVNVQQHAAYMAPEVADGVFSVASDLYSLTAVLFEALTHTRPSSDSIIQQEQVKAASLPPVWSHLLIKGLHPQAQERYQALIEAFHQLGFYQKRAVRAPIQVDHQQERKPDVMNEAESRKQHDTEEAALPWQGTLPMPQKPDALIALGWTASILGCLVLFLLLAR